MVELEAAKTILNLKKTNADHQMVAINTLKSLLTVPRTVTRFAAVRLLNKIAMRDPEIIRVCNDVLESMINDSNRSIATYAITTLLKTGGADNVDRLVKTISSFMDDISDEFKIIVIEAIGTLSLKFPVKYKSMLEFLNGLLGDEGGAPIKTAIVDAILDIVKFIPESRDFALDMLCEFIEDCEYTNLATKVIFILGEQGPHTKNPSLYVRHIYNRVVLENSIIRCAAVSALSKFALIEDESLTKSIKILLKRCLQDEDDEVRDRSALALRFLSANDKSKAKPYVDPQFGYWLADLEKQLSLYVNNEDKSSFNTPFDITVVTAVSAEQLKSEEYRLKTSAFDEPVAKSTSGKSKEDSADAEEKVSDATKQALLQQKYADELATIPEIAAYGTLLHSSGSTALSDPDSELVVDAIKHVFEDHLVIQYNIKNTLPESQLEELSIVAEPDSEEYAEEFVVPIDSLKPNATGTIYVSFTRPAEIELASFENVIAFTSKDIDPSTGEPADDDEGYPDEFPITEPFSITPGDFVVPQFTANFTKSWDELGNESSAIFNLGDSDTVDLQAAVSGLVKSLSMMPLESTNLVASSANHTLKLFGKSIQGDKIASVIRLAASSKGVMMKHQCRSTNATLAELVANHVE
ncbi:unnamed protein product [Ambrosiozyma monospora]|uniref:Unnamed protein product n=1 Tax=Ambrosiozyma monospora TaxID=43982 RepID=A0A9W6YQB2_AMBMO|nr:unnamed protein product [Ambrosiozyma monospora]